MACEPMILGLENELLAGVSSPEKRPHVQRVIMELLQTLRRHIPCVLNAEQPNTSPGIMLGNNGSRIYVDGPSYLECATPEVRTPEEVLAYQRANEWLVLEGLI
ncbi:MAG: proteasome accessory factor PafA2 family protein, partial [Verrucomicrobia bacterium]|nr:proteasome accessory factor PafA2 family protein [Verrucomicrobiota bacterium]